MPLFASITRCKRAPSGMGTLLTSKDDPLTLPLDLNNGQIYLTTDPKAPICNASIFVGKSKASVTILADFGPEFDPPFRWRSKHQTKNHSAYH